MAKIANVTAADFDAAVTDHPGLVLIDLWGPGCVPCRALAPIVDDLAEDFAGEVAVCKINVEDEQDLFQRLAVRGVPTLALFRDGAEIDRITGMRTRSQLAAWIEGHL